MTDEPNRDYLRTIERAVDAALGRTRYGYDVFKMSKLRATVDSAEYYNAHMSKAPNYSARVRLLDAAVKMISIDDGLVLEFGVASGRTINRIADALPNRTIHGFDGFTGLPETWTAKFNEGHFAQEIPAVRSNVQLHVGLFNRTLPGFTAAADPTKPLSFLHIDCDLYSSTKTVFTHLGERIVPGTVILFDEYFNYPGWRQHEYLAFQELVAERGLTYDYRGIVGSHYQVAVVITGA